ncbi:MAG: carbon-nitrogen hydrolase family protein [Aestuariivirgaceae bacterium]
MNSQKFSAGLVQMCSSREVERNMAEASALIREAAAAGAELIATPEMTNILDTDRQRVAAIVRAERDDPAPQAFSELAKELGVHILIGSLALKSAQQKLINRSLLFSPSGDVLARYDKIHMFDVDLGNEQKFRESQGYEAGRRAVAADLPWGRIGLSVCYDLRFPVLYNSLAKAGSYLLSVPSAFTRVTGEAHWHVLLRARAIENAAFVLAPAQTGRHECGRESYGHSLIVGPWGDVIGEGGKAPGVVMATIDLSHVITARRRIPALSHARGWGLVRAGGSGEDAP